MRISFFGSSFLAISLLLTGCSTGTDNQDRSGASASDMAWNDDSRAQLQQALSNRAAHGLDRMNFGLDAEAGADARDEQVTEAALAYAAALARGATDPAKLHEIYTVPRPSPDLRHGLGQALRENRLTAWLDSLAPQDASYRKLSQTYLALSRQGNDGTPAIPVMSEPLKPGADDPRVPAIARQLAASGYLDNAAGTDTRYSPALVGAVRRMQADYGIEPDGVIGTEALQILNLSDADRARAIAVNMERMRWLERTPPATRIDVNTAAAQLSYWRDSELADVRRVIVGAPDTETPLLGSPIYRLVANPTWTVPRSIEEKELAGKSADYLRRNNMAREDGWIVQQPGPENSLGLVKFDMKNEHAIYLHDTPAKALFDQVQRQRSHGCVRVQDALGFAEMLARDEGVTDEWRKARETGDETFVPLPREIPVRLLYQTVIFDDAGEPVVRDDPYGWNNAVAAALGFGVGSDRRVRSDRGDVGP